MATNPSELADRLRQPAYTGENRCTPCTVLNAGIAVGLAVLGTVLLSPLVGGVVLVGSLATIYFRGYLVPGTPELTKQYLPDSVLRWFGKAPELPEPGETIDVEAYLLEVGAVESRGDGDSDELALTDGFADDWDAAIENSRTRMAAAAGELLDLADPGIEDRGEACVVTDGGMAAADWPSRTALLLDLGAVGLLRERDRAWAGRTREEQGRILAGLRVFAETCPGCGATPELGEETVESCCRQAEVVTYSCPDCGARLLELET